MMLGKRILSLSLVALFFAVLLGGCSSPVTTTVNNASARIGESSFKIIVDGDSRSLGLNLQNKMPWAFVVNWGIGGQTTSDMCNRMVLNNGHEHYNAAIIEIGINNKNSGQSISDEDGIKNIHAIIDYYSSLADRVYFIWTYPTCPWLAYNNFWWIMPNPTESNRAAAVLTAAAKSYGATKSNFTYIDLSYMACPNGYLIPEFTSDGVHPNEAFVNLQVSVICQAMLSGK